MKTFRLIGLVLVVAILELSCSESGREINSDQLQKRGDDLYYAVNEEKPYSGKVVELYESGQKRMELTLKNGKLHGLSTIWYDNGQKQKEGAYKDGKEDGQWIFWYDNGQKQKEGAYKDGKREGRWDFWTKDGEQLQTDTVTDIDGHTYLTIKIGEQWWMAENLKVTRYRNGDAIPNVTDENAWSNLRTGAYCDYDNSADNAATYGHLYNWYAVNDPRGLAPEGWHVPSDAEWQTLVDYLGGESVAGGKLKETARWSSPNTGATNESGFSALPGGFRSLSGNFYPIGTNATFWSSTESGGHNAWYRYLPYSSSGVFRYSNSRQGGFSVRCVRD